jgi:hypothetical protein
MCKMEALFPIYASIRVAIKSFNEKRDRQALSRCLQPIEKWGFRKFTKAPFLLVGTTRFELATSRTPINLRANHKFS